jgi:hypothetical protein
MEEKRLGKKENSRGRRKLKKGGNVTMIITAEMTVIGRQEIIATVQSPGPGPLDVTDRLVPTETIPGTGIVTAILRIDIETNARPEVIEIRNAGNFCLQ